ncbi:ABC transporter permease [Neobacillus sp. MM2021_6]|uniref:ABC transporter permease n=1 Tax=Bacillaceae TaxID=186817 RepID=UPI00140AD2CF|nr:ABC transporter permease [Neobacillus sp. MM2021_6]NHC20108.1 ABC transporter permease subunit [Bacillus sp. MM2020_4]
MRKLISLEIKKFKLYSYLKAVGIANLVIMGLLCLIYFMEKSEGTLAFGSYEMAFAAFNSIIRPTFIIFAAVLISRIIIDEYKSNSITLMFMYPISRKKIMIAKLVIVACFTFFTIVLSNLIIGSLFYLVDSYLHFVPKELTAEVLKNGLIQMILEAIASAGMALIPLYFGMRKKSVPTTIVTAIIMVSLTSSSADGVNLFAFIAIPIALALIGCLIAYLSIRNVEKVDIN